MSHILATQLEGAGNNPLVRLRSSILGPFADSFLGNRGGTPAGRHPFRHLEFSIHGDKSQPSSI